MSSTWPSTANTIETADGRRLEVFVAGPDDGVAVIRNHGTPSCGMLYPARVADAAERGLRLVGWSRPGYGGSDRQEGRLVADCAADIAAVADAIGAERFYVEGGSGGGPHALAAAALLPERVLAAASVAGVAPWGAEGLDWLAGMGEENVEEFGAAQAGGRALSDFLEPRRAEMLKSDPAATREVLKTLLSEVDARAFSGELADFLAVQSAHALEPGIWGWYDDDIEFARPWGFDLGAIDVPVAVWQGGEDRFVPFAHGEWLAAHVPGAAAHLLPEEGHLSIAERKYGEVLDELIAVATGRGG
ncbi:MAG: alpha/beta fold hydrolase [Thermoleophilaceae bacterium]